MLASNWQVRTSRRGEFWRVLLPGAFTMRAWHRDKFGYMVSDLVCVEVRVNNRLIQGELEGGRNSFFYPLI